MAADPLSSALSQAPDKQRRGGNICTCLKFQPCCVVVPGKQAEILENLVAPAQLVLTAVSYAREAQINLSAVCLCCCMFVVCVLLSWRDKRCSSENISLEKTVLTIFILGEIFCVWLDFTMLAAPHSGAGCSY